MKRWWLLIPITFFVGGCAPSYWVLDNDLRAARAGNVGSIRATRDENDTDPLRLKAASLEEIHPEESRGTTVRVTPRHTRLKVGWALLGIGAGLVLSGVAAGLSSLSPCTGDEACWLPQLIAGSTLGSIGGASMIAGAAVAGTSLRESEMR